MVDRHSAARLGHPVALQHAGTESLLEGMSRLRWQRRAADVGESQRRRVPVSRGGVQEGGSIAGTPMKTVTRSRSIVSSAEGVEARRAASQAPAAIGAFMQPVIPNTCESGADPKRTSSSRPRARAMGLGVRTQHRVGDSIRFGRPVVPDV